MRCRLQHVLLDGVSHALTVDKGVATMQHHHKTEIITLLAMVGILLTSACNGSPHREPRAEKPRQSSKQVEDEGRALEVSKEVMDFVKESSSSICLSSDPIPDTLVLTQPEMEFIWKRIMSTPDHTSYRLLFLALTKSQGKYTVFPYDTMAKILCATLVRTPDLNDWGRVCIQPYDGFAARLLLSTGDFAIKYLVPILDNKKAAPLFGSIIAAMSDTFRRCDYAYRYICLIKGFGYKGERTYQERDKMIESLKKKLAKTGE
jgi:hypothetical protein